MLIRSVTGGLIATSFTQFASNVFPKDAEIASRATTQLNLYAEKPIQQDESLEKSKPSRENKVRKLFNQFPNLKVLRVSFPSTLCILTEPNRRTTLRLDIPAILTYDRQEKRFHATVCPFFGDSSTSQSDPFLESHDVATDCLKVTWTDSSETYLWMMELVEPQDRLVRRLRIDCDSLFRPASRLLEATGYNIATLPADFDPTSVTLRGYVAIEEDEVRPVR